MYYQKIIFSLLLFCTISLAYEDYDIDGVDDSIDQCLNTPFDKIVDYRGCASDKKPYYGVLILKIGSDISFDTFDKKTTNFNLYVNYRYKNLDISLSNSSYNTYDNFNNISRTKGDLYLSSGYFIKKDKFNTKLTLGTKFATADEDVGSGEDDYFASINFNYFANINQDIFFYYAYTLSGDSDTINYEDYHSFSIGSGYAINSKWYSALAYDYSGSNYQNGNVYKSISWFNSYSFSKKFFTTLNYSHALDDLSYDHTLSLKFGIRYE